MALEKNDVDEGASSALSSALPTKGVIARGLLFIAALNLIFVVALGFYVHLWVYLFEKGWNII